MIFIDWMSPREHSNFNRAFLGAVKPERATLFVFSELLRSQVLDTVVLNDQNTRLGRAWNILKLAWHHRRETLFFLSYDPLFVPLVSLIAQRVFVFEHNTVPEGNGRRKHSIWQFLFTRSVTRCAQFPGQVTVLTKLRQRCFYLGSPLSEKTRQAPVVDPSRAYFVVPSYRSGLGGLRALAPFAQNRTALIKGAGRTAELEGMDLEFTDHILLRDRESEVRGIVVLGDSRIRGSGWFNDAIKFGLPVVITSPQTAQLFEETFPNYPYVNVPACRDQESFDRELERARAFDASEYVRQHNRAFLARYLQIMHNASSGGGSEILSQVRRERHETREHGKPMAQNHDAEVSL